jgi:hypothetical protein
MTQLIPHADLIRAVLDGATLVVKSKTYAAVEYSGRTALQVLATWDENDLDTQVSLKPKILEKYVVICRYKYEDAVITSIVSSSEVAWLKDSHLKNTGNYKNLQIIRLELDENTLALISASSSQPSV